MKKQMILLLAAATLALVNCKSSTTDSTTTDSTETCDTGTDVVETPTMINTPTSLTCTTNIATSAPDWIKNNFHCVTVKVCSSTYVFVLNDLPPYKTGYYSVASGNNTTFPTTGLSDGSSRTKNPNTISSQSITFTIPKTPTLKTSSLDATSGSGLDCIGVSKYGVCIFNNQAAPGDSLATEFQTMDNGDGHPQSTGKYHHHTEPFYLSDDDSNFIGVALDGYPIYGKKSQNGTYPTLDSNTHTVSCTTTDFPSGTYCYHVGNGTGVNGYMLGTYFRGTKGSTQ